MIFLFFIFYSLASIKEILPYNLGYYLFGSHENPINFLLNQPIKSFVTSKENEFYRYDLPFLTRFLAAFFKYFQEQSLEQTKFNDWRITKSRTGNFTIRFFDYYKPKAITFSPIPDEYDCSIKHFKIYYARNAKIIGNSKVFTLQKNLTYTQEFTFDHCCDQKIDSIKLYVLDNWGSYDSICLRKYSVRI